MPLAEIILGLPLHYPIRIFILRLLGAEIGKNVIIYNVKFIHYCEGSFKNLIIGSNSYIAPNTTIDLRDKVTIKENATISPNVLILTHSNSNNDLSRIYPYKHKEVVIGKNSWICAGAVILCGVKIGDNSVVGAGSVVTKNVDSNSLFAGIPAKKIKEIKI